MSAVCAVVVLGGQVAAGAPLPSPEKHLRIRVPSARELSCDEATTPEASTDSDNDSAFESDNEAAGSKRGPPSSPAPHGKKASPADLSVPDHHTGRRRRCNNGGLSQQQQQKLEQQPLPRKVRFALHAEVDAEHSTTTAQFTTRLDWDNGGESRAAVQESALLALGMMKNTADSADRPAINGQRRQTSRFGRNESNPSSTASRFFKGQPGCSAINTVAPPPTAASSTKHGIEKAARHSSKAAAATAAAAAMAGKNKRVPAPLKNSGANSFLVALPSCPSSPKKRKALSLLRLRPRGSGVSAGGDGGGTHVRRASRSRAGASRAHLFEAAASKRSPASPVAAAPRVEQVSPPDLMCAEELDVDAVMKPKGEVRTPICRFLVPCWPEGVEGYEEVGGWRRLGGPVRENYPKERRCV